MKIKLSGNDEDIDKIKAIKSVTPAGLGFIVDANQGFKDPKEAVAVLNKIGEILKNVAGVEEPMPKGEYDDIKYVKENVKDMLIFADETVAVFEDAKKLIEKEAAHGINIKLQKAGGIWQGKRIAEIAQKAGVKVMVGCMLEGPLAIGAGIAFADSTANVVLTDLDSDLGMKKHTLVQYPFEDGERKTLDAPGLGVEYDEKVISDLVASGELIWEKVV
jgi:L-alanine-DL-glutamate epimerase-like enolase superfamily enzyme